MLRPVLLASLLLATPAMADPNLTISAAFSGFDGDHCLTEATIVISGDPGFDTLTGDMHYYRWWQNIGRSRIAVFEGLLDNASVTIQVVDPFSNDCQRAASHHFVVTSCSLDGERLPRETCAAALQAGRGVSEIEVFGAD